MPRLKTVIAYSGISSARFIRLSRICVGNGLLLIVFSWMHQTGRLWRLLVQACGPILVKSRYSSASASLSKVEKTNLAKVNTRLPKVLYSCNNGVMGNGAMEYWSLVKRYQPINHYSRAPIPQHSDVSQDDNHPLMSLQTDYRSLKKSSRHFHLQ